MDRGVAHLLSPDLVTVIRTGDESVARSAFETLYRATYESLFSHVYAIVKSSDEARDILGDTFLALWRMRTTWNPPLGARAYLFTAVRNRALNAIRNDIRRRDLHVFATHAGDTIAHGNAPLLLDDRLILTETSHAIQAAVNTLRGSQREIVILRWKHELSFAEIAVILNISENAAKLHMSRAMRVLRTLLSGLEKQD